MTVCLGLAGSCGHQRGSAGEVEDLCALVEQASDDDDMIEARNFAVKGFECEGGLKRKDCRSRRYKDEARLQTTYEAYARTLEACEAGESARWEALTGGKRTANYAQSHMSGFKAIPGRRVLVTIDRAERQILIVYGYWLDGPWNEPLDPAEIAEIDRLTAAAHAQILARTATPGAAAPSGDCGDLQAIAAAASDIAGNVRKGERLPDPAEAQGDMTFGGRYAIAGGLRVPGATQCFVEFSANVWLYACDFAAADAGRLDWAQRCVEGLAGHTVAREGDLLRISRGDGQGFTNLRVRGTRLQMGGM